MPDPNQCPYRPTQGGNAGVQCLLPAGHPATQAHIHDPGKLPAVTADGDASAFTNDEIADAIAEDEIQRRAEALSAAQGVWEQAAWRAHPKIPCPECTGNGQVVGGSLGDHCPSCNGTRMVDDQSVDVDFQMPDFKALRDPLNAYGDALIHRRYGKPMALPPASTVPTMAQIAELRASGQQRYQALAAGAGPALPQLPPAKPLKRTGLENEGGIDQAADDDELDAIEAEFSDHPGDR